VERFHYLVYVAGIAVFAHSLLTDPHLKGQVDFLDGEKLLVEFCGAATLVFGVYGVKRKRNRLRELQGLDRQPQDDGEQTLLGMRIGKFTNQRPVNLRQSGKTDNFTEASQELTPAHRSRPQTVISSRNGPSN
jgi:hypothetical protein